MFEDKIAEMNQAVMERPVQAEGSSAYNLVKKNLFRSVRIGGHIRVSKRSFDEWLDTQL